MPGPDGISAPCVRLDTLRQQVATAHAFISTLSESDLPTEAIEYQAALGLEWDTPWFHPDEFCGSRGMTLPLLGLRIRVLGDAAQTHAVRYWASFCGPRRTRAVCPGRTVRVRGRRDRGAARGDRPGGRAEADAGTAPRVARRAAVRVRHWFFVRSVKLGWGKRPSR